MFPLIQLTKKLEVCTENCGNGATSVSINSTYKEVRSMLHVAYGLLFHVMFPLIQLTKKLEVDINYVTSQSIDEMATFPLIQLTKKLEETSAIAQVGRAWNKCFH